MVTWRSTIMPRNARCEQLSWAGKTICSRDRMLEANEQQRSTALSEQQNSTASTLKRTCAKCSHASPIIPSTASKSCCHGTLQRSSLETQAALHSHHQAVISFAVDTNSTGVEPSTAPAASYRRVRPPHRA